MLELGYHLSSEEHPAPDLVGYARRAEEAGFAYAVISDHFHPWTRRQGQSPFAWTVLGAIAQATRRLRVGTAVTAPIRRMQPYLVAQAAATVATLLPGRFFLGAGTGEDLNEHVTGAWWPTADVRREMLEEAVGLIRELWSGRTVEHRGRHYTVVGARIYSRPAEPPPIVIAVGGSRAATLAGRIGDGMVGVSPVAELTRSFADAGGGDRPCYGQLDVCVAETAAESRRIARAQWAAPAAIPRRLLTELRLPGEFEEVAELVGEDEIAERIVSGADPDEHVERIEAYVQAGFDHVHVHQVGDDQMAFFRFYEREVLPRVRRLHDEPGRLRCPG
jgi:G6PDH family F420-dependent oxidoreductase